jgi:hypothetical protein
MQDNSFDPSEDRPEYADGQGSEVENKERGGQMLRLEV